jgi:hypothetical protein
MLERPGLVMLGHTKAHPELLVLYRTLKQHTVDVAVDAVAVRIVAGAFAAGVVVAVELAANNLLVERDRKSLKMNSHGCLQALLVLPKSAQGAALASAAARSER